MGWVVVVKASRGKRRRKLAERLRAIQPDDDVAGSGGRGDSTPQPGITQGSVPESDTKRQTFEAEALPHLDTVYRVALRLAGDESRAEDLVQETMLRAYRSWHQYTRGTNARAWLLTILRHTFINQYRKAKRAAVEVDIHQIEPYTVFHDVQETDPEGAFFDTIVDDEVLRAIDTLPDEFRETLILSDVEGLAYAEIAAITEVPVGTVKSRLFRARQALQRQLYDYAVEMGYIQRREA
ncbi:MAG: sigma-70 family RNA polymerase sigma factor [Gemmatimonadota bacterium]|nr:sigma-70 family RNA polymerase sigma factor [Gemmatimonadota bacterium]